MACRSGLRQVEHAIETGRPLAADGRWGRATVEALLAIDQSGQERREILLKHQTAYPD